MSSTIEQTSGSGLLGFHDALSLSGLSAARFRFLEKEFGRCVGIETHFFLPARYSPEQVGLLLKVEDVLNRSGRPPEQVRERIEKYLTLRKKGIWMAAVTSGKGGVGKTSLAVNLAVSLARRGVEPTIVDADLGLANTHLLLGLLPERDLQDLLRGRASLEQIMVKSRHGVSLIPGASGSKELAELNREGRERLATELRNLYYHTDTIIIDTGSGISENVLRFLRLADDVIVVITPNVASCIDALGLVQAAGREGCGGRINVLVNRCRDSVEAEEVFCRFSRAVTRSGATSPWFLGYVPEDHHLEEAYQLGMPVTSHSPSCGASRSVRQIAKTILSDRRDPRSGRDEEILKIFEGLAAAG